MVNPLVNPLVNPYTKSVYKCHRSDQISQYGHSDRLANFETSKCDSSKTIPKIAKCSDTILIYVLKSSEMDLQHQRVTVARETVCGARQLNRFTQTHEDIWQRRSPVYPRTPDTCERGPTALKRRGSPKKVGGVRR